MVNEKLKALIKPGCKTGDWAEAETTLTAVAVATCGAQDTPKLLPLHWLPSRREGQEGLQGPTEKRGR